MPTVAIVLHRRSFDPGMRCGKFTWIWSMKSDVCVVETPLLHGGSPKPGIVWQSRKMVRRNKRDGKETVAVETPRKQKRGL